MKKLIINLFLLFLAFTFIGIVYYRTYAIINNSIEIQSYIKEYTNIYDIQIRYSEDFLNKKYILFTYENNSKIGLSILSKGINNLYKISETEFWNSFSVSDRWFHYKDSTYCLLSGKNPDKEIKLVQFSVNNFALKNKLPDEEFFITVFKLDKNLSYNIPDIIFFDDLNNDITDNIRNKYQPIRNCKSIHNISEDHLIYFLIIITLIIALVRVNKGLR